MRTVLSWAWLVCAMLWLGLPAPALAQGLDALGELEDKAREEVDEADAAREARLKALERMQGRYGARVVVLPWPEAGTTYKNVLLQANVRNRIGRPNAKFYPSIDLYQEGRRARVLDGRPVRWQEQPGRLSDERLEQIRRQIDALSRQISGDDDLRTAGRLLPLVDELFFVDRLEVREVLFDLYLAIGRAVLNPQNQTPPYFRMVGRLSANYYLYLAAAMVWEEGNLADGEPRPERMLADRLPNDRVGRAVRDLVEAIGYGDHPPIPVSFSDGGMFDARAFNGDYTVVINGLQRLVPRTGLVHTPRGRIDVSLERSDGFGMSERIEVVRLDEKIYFAVETARQNMGYELLNRLMMLPADCAPALPESTRGTLATYAALHPGEELYVAIPKAGSPYDVFVWRWDPRDGLLKQQVDRNRGFPVRFALLGGVGMSFNNATFSQTRADELTSETLDPTAFASGQGFSGIDPGDLSELINLDIGGLDVDFQLRGHFNRLMFGFGMQVSRNLAGVDQGNVWRERYQTGGRPVVQAVPADPTDPEGGGTVFQERFRELQWARHLYGQLGVFLLKNAPFGIGPRGFLRAGWRNAPNAVDLSLHVGATEDPSFGKKEPKGRVVPLIDLDLFAGMLIPVGDTLFLVDTTDRNGNAVQRPQLLLNFGFAVGTGFSF